MFKSNTKFGAFRSLTLTSVIAACSIGVSQAALVINLEGSAGSSLVSVTLSGDSVATGLGQLPSGGLRRIDFEHDPGVSFLGDSSNTGTLAFTSMDAEISNRTQSTSGTLTGLRLRGGFRDDEIGIVSDTRILYRSGETVSWSGSGTIDLAGTGVSFSDLTVGSYTTTDNRLSWELNISSAAASSVPEPSSLLMSGLGLLAMTARRKRKA